MRATVVIASLRFVVASAFAEELDLEILVRDASAESSEDGGVFRSGQAGSMWFDGSIGRAMIACNQEPMAGLLLFASFNSNWRILRSVVPDNCLILFVAGDVEVELQPRFPTSLSLDCSGRDGLSRRALPQGCPEWFPTSLFSIVVSRRIKLVGPFKKKGDLGTSLRNARQAPWHKTPEIVHEVEGRRIKLVGPFKKKGDLGTSLRNARQAPWHKTPEIVHEEQEAFMFSLTESQQQSKFYFSSADVLTSGEQLMKLKILLNPLKIFCSPH
ncbi:unnamed protein product [Notodromas monacha]|uniref:Uncharacterized protein n=1 Tax=Notodromas monacha TaxID=399045 RepID=A0A7R9BQ68_9CRUS|nr:unnamed protein product [Notodromas monacha]CAG0918304.1 unnamed protein product [Notodromas monacha]